MQYDQIVKQNIKKAQGALLKHVCKVQATNWEEVPRDVPKTIERRTDWIKIGTDVATNQKTLYHLEFQSSNDADMAVRMLFYWVLCHERYKLPIRQFVIYMGEGKPTMPNILIKDKVYFEYQVIAINTIDYELFLQSENAESIIWAILADFKKEENEVVIQKILQTLRDKTPNKNKLTKYLKQLELLSGLRDYQSIIIKKLEAMSINYDITKDLRYIQGAEDGEVRGEARGEERGKEIGKSFAADVIKLHLKGKSIEEISAILGTEEAEVQDVIAVFLSED